MGTIGIGEASHGRNDEVVKHYIETLKPRLIEWNVFELEKLSFPFFP